MHNGMHRADRDLGVMTRALRRVGVDPRNHGQTSPAEDRFDHALAATSDESDSGR